MVGRGHVGVRMSIAVDAVGLPAMPLPIGIVNGLPQAVQVIGPRYREDCLARGSAQAWHHHTN